MTSPAQLALLAPPAKPPPPDLRGAVEPVVIGGDAVEGTPDLDAAPCGGYADGDAAVEDATDADGMYCTYCTGPLAALTCKPAAGPASRLLPLPLLEPPLRVEEAATAYATLAAAMSAGVAPASMGTRALLPEAPAAPSMLTAA